MKIDSTATTALQPAADPQQQQKTAKIKHAATQFESLMIGQLLKGMHSADGGWLGTGDDASGSTAMEMAEEHLAQMLAAQGGLGLANMVAQGLDRPSATSTPPAMPGGGGETAPVSNR